MSKSGQNNFKGINFQVWTALSLFLQFLKKPEFSHIQLEGHDLEDFTLYFNDGAKILGEAKVRTEKVQAGVLKEILVNIIDRKTLNPGDKILITCNEVSEDLLGDVKYAQHFEPIRDKLKKVSKYTDEQISLLQYVDFWVVKPGSNEELVRSLVADVIDLWLPKEDLERFVTDLAQRFSSFSATGSTYYKGDFLSEIKDLKSKSVANASYYNPEYAKTAEQYDDIEKALDGTSAKKKELARSSISALSANFGLLTFARNILQTKKIDDLKNWDSLWQLNRLNYFGYGIFDVFKKNLHTKKNREYIVAYCKEYSAGMRGFYQDDYFANNATDILGKILELASPTEKKSYVPIIFSIISELLKSKYDEASYLKRSQYDGHKKWEKEVVCRLLKDVYLMGDKTLKRKIIDFIWKNFNLTEDDDNLTRNVPLEVYFIIADWLRNDFARNFSIFVKNINQQYRNSYGRFSRRGKNIYDGWEHMGGGTSFAGSGYHLRDRHFVTNILQDIIEKRYHANTKGTWEFIKKNCLFSEKDISEKKPDFLNRAVYEIVVERYVDSSPKKSDEAHRILEDFILQRKGIPHKSELIYQKVARMGNRISPEKKFRLAKITLGKYKVPVNPFVEEIVRDLALDGNEEAREEILSWFSNEKYYNQGRLGGSVATSSIVLFIEKDLGFAVKLLKEFISSDYFGGDKFELFDTYDIARTIAKITQVDPPKGISILNDIRKIKNWGRNQRVLFCFGLFDHFHKETFTKETLLKVYQEVVDPFLTDLGNDADKISKLIPEAGFRAAIVQFAENLTEHQTSLIKEAVRIISVFVNDPDPYLPGKDPDAENEQYNQHKNIIENGSDTTSITTVRGWCSWTLMKCAILEGRSEIDTIISLVSKLIQDKNYFALHMASFALSQLGHVSLTYIDETKTELFLDPDPKKALRKAKEIEKTAFEYAERVIRLPEENARKVLGKSVLKVFDNIRALNQKDAVRFLKLIGKLPLEIQEDAAPFFIFYAFFRKASYKGFKFRFPGLYDDIDSTSYDEFVFEEMLEKSIKKIQSENPDGCFKIVANIEHTLKRSGEDKVMESRFFKILSVITEEYGHHTFGLLHTTIIEMFEDSSLGFKKWFGLLKKTFQSELEFYRKKGLLVTRDKMPPDAGQYYWYPSLWMDKIFHRVLEFGGDKEFMEIMEIVTKFPLGFELHVEGDPINKLIEMSKSGNVKAKAILKKLYDFDPGKWRYLKDEIK